MEQEVGKIGNGKVRSFKRVSEKAVMINQRVYESVE